MRILRVGILACVFTGCVGVGLCDAPKKTQAGTTDKDSKTTTASKGTASKTDPKGGASKGSGKTPATK